MATRGTVVEFVPMFEGEQTFKDLLLSIIVDKIILKTDDSPLPKEETIDYNDSMVPMISLTPGLCGGVS